MARPSSLRHPLAVLRKILEMSQQDFAELVNCSVATIQSVELGRLRLSLALAERIRDATGISVNWLIRGNPSDPPETDPLLFDPPTLYTKEHFEKTQQRCELQSLHEAEAILDTYHYELLAIARSARQRGRETLRMFIGEVETLFKDPILALKFNYGFDNAYLTARKGKIDRRFQIIVTNSEEEES